VSPISWNVYALVMLGLRAHGNLPVNSEQYRRTARRCLILARQMTDLQRRAAMLDAATLWVGLAQRAENNNQVTQQQQQTQPKIERYRNA
jgi:hypothetical protein